MFWTYFFYSLGFFAIISEFRHILKPTEILQAVEAIKKNGKMKGLRDDERGLVFIMFVYFIWSVAGLFSSQWFFFLCLFILSVSKEIAMTYAKKGKRAIVVADGVLSLLIVFAIIINRFHFNWQPF